MKKALKIPELLSPAGSYEKMEYAFAYGADAVYAGIPRFSLRARENDFTEELLVKAIDFTHHLGKKIYLTMNIYPHNRKINSFTEMLDRVSGMNADGLIMADPGMIGVALEKYPDLNIHLSTQANTINWQTVRFWKSLGVKRIILSRELNIPEIAEIRQRVPDIELETFIHGAICIAYSGRCLLSNYFTHRDANQGTCTNACRWQYNLYQEKNTGDTKINNGGGFFLEESERPGQLMPVDEDEHGTYIMNARDLSAMHILNELIEAGVDSVKIEGRTKSLYYLSVITGAYRKALDSCTKESGIPERVFNEVYAVANRGYISGFLEKNPGADGQNYLQSHSGNQTRRFLGVIRSWDDAENMAAIEVRNRFNPGDRVEIFSPQSVEEMVIEEIFSSKGHRLEAAHGGGENIRLKLSHKPKPYSILRKIL